MKKFPDRNSQKTIEKMIGTHTEGRLSPKNYNKERVEEKKTRGRPRKMLFD